MRMSIRTKLFVTLSGLILSFVLISLCLTHLYLEKFYIWQKKDLLITSSVDINNVYDGNPEDISLELERVTGTLGAGLFIFTEDGQIKYSSFGPIVNRKTARPRPQQYTPDGFPEPPPNFAAIPTGPPHMLKSREVIGQDTVIEMHQDSDLKIEFMLLEHQLKNNDILVIRQPLAPMSESAVLAAHFMIFTGILCIIFGCIWAFFFAKKFTLPILELSHIAQAMAHLDFSKKCTIHNSGELGLLGQSINHLSTQLDTAISELNDKNRQLMADVEKERKLDKMRKDFVSSVSHELKTPLALILGYAEGLKDDVVHDEDSKNYYCSVIIDEAVKMDKLVKSLLNLSQIESGVFALNRTDFDLAPILYTLAPKYQAILAEKGIQLTIDSENFVVNGDPLSLEQVILNLFTNAINHAEGAKQIRIQARDLSSHVRISVFNTGKPIPQDSLEKLWTSFYKVDKARTREYGGYGLGLSIVRATQDLHGNKYGVANVQDGVVFWVDFSKSQKI